jgi:putative DNA primase/helicase
VIRVSEVNGEHLPTAFSTWCPMAIAGIGSQRDTLMSRSVIISLRRKLPTETVARLPYDLNSQLLSLRRQIARWAADNAVTIGAMEIEPPPCGNDRMQDNFTPLWRIAAALGEPWPDRLAAAYATQAMAEDEDAEPAGIMMLRDIADIFASSRADRIATSEIVGDLMVMEERPWADWRHGKPINAQSVAKQMKPFGVKVRVLKVNGSSARVYLRSDVEAAAARYASQKCNPVTFQKNQQVSDFSRRNLELKVTPENPDKPLKTKEGYGVTPKQPDQPDADDLQNPDSWG